MLKKIVALVQGQSHCVLATGSASGPHASLMSFCPAPDCGEFWLATLRDTRKYRNLQADPRASLLLDDRAEHGGSPGLALSVEADLAPFASAAAADAARRALVQRHPQLAAFLAQDGVVVLRLAARRFQLLEGLTEVFAAPVEKMLDAGKRKA